MTTPKFYEYIEINQEPIPDGIVSGGIVTWLHDLVFSMSAIVYYLTGIRFAIPTTEFTLDPADPDNPRIDVIAVDNTGSLIIIKGVPNVSPQKPSIDTTTQIELTYVLVQAGATVPDGVTDELIYDENVEWVGSSNGVVVNFDYTLEHKIGSKCTEVGTIGNNDTITYTAAAPVNVADYADLSFFLKLKAVASTKNAMYVKFLLNGISVTQEIAISWLITDITNWQNIALQLADFTFTEVTFDAIQIRWSRVQSTTTTHVGFFLDYIKLQIGLSIPIYVDTVELIGDVTAKGKTGIPINSALKVVNSNVGVFGSATKSVSITVDAKGRITAVSENDIEGGGGTDGREVELSTSGGYVVWRYVGDVSWINLFVIPSDGDDGVSAFVYIAYASDSSGTGFTTTFDAALNWIAIKPSTVAIPSPVVGDFVGLWKNYKGADGSPGAVPLVVSGITLSSASWTGPTGGFYEYDLANANITATCVVDGIPSKASSAIVKAAEIEPEGIVTAGHVKFYAINSPTGDISLTIVITEATS
jgi:hypothetical protein